jgi:hypothetical protein
MVMMVLDSEEIVLGALKSLAQCFSAAGHTN